MEALYDNKHIYGNFMQGDRQQFPLDIETLEALQNNTSLCAVLGRIVGVDKVILCGCEDRTPRPAGYVWMKTARAPQTGEILYYEGGGSGESSAPCHIREVNETITISPNNYENAYTTRTLYPGMGSNGADTYTWGAFIRIDGELTLKDIVVQMLNLNENIISIKNNSQFTFVRGMIMLWYGRIYDIPDGWVLCDGRTCTIKGETFKVPDLREKFVMGAYSDDPASGHAYPDKEGGVTRTMVTLTVDNLPGHHHAGTTDDYESNDYVTIAQPLNTTGWPTHADAIGDGGNATNGAQAHWRGHSDTSLRKVHAHKHSFTTNNAGSGMPFGVDVRPPYYALAYIMKL